jgi:hypothetical protein
MLPTPATGALAVKSDANSAIFAASVIVSSRAPGWIEYAAPEASCEVKPAVA